MPNALSLDFCVNYVRQYFESRGKIKPHADLEVFTIGQLKLDNPAPPGGDPHWEKKIVVKEMKRFFRNVDAVVGSPLPVLKKSDKTLMDLARFLHENHSMTATPQ